MANTRVRALKLQSVLLRASPRGRGSPHIEIIQKKTTTGDTFTGLHLLRSTIHSKSEHFLVWKCRVIVVIFFCFDDLELESIRARVVTKNTHMDQAGNVNQ